MAAHFLTAYVGAAGQVRDAAPAGAALHAAYTLTLSLNTVLPVIFYTVGIEGLRGLQQCHGVHAPYAA